MTAAGSTGVVGGTRRIVRSAFAFDASQLSPGEGLRSAVGVALPLLLGIVLERPLYGVAAAGGALSVGFAAFQGAYRTRAAAALLASIGMTVSTLVGAVAGHSAVAIILLGGLWGVGGGLLVALGQAASVVGLQSVVALLVVSQFPMSTSTAVLRAVLVLAGGLAQTLLVVSLWPLQRFPAERRGLAAAYDSLARYARTLPTEEPLPPDPGAMVGLGAALRDPQPFARRAEVTAFRGLGDEADRIRTSLASLAESRRRLAVGGSRDDAVAAIDEVLATAADALAEVADAVATARAPQLPDEQRARLDDAVTRLAGAAATAGPARGHVGASVVGEAARRVQTLRGQLRAVRRIAAVPAGGPPDPGMSTPAARQRVLPVRDATAALLANLTLRSTAYRHALRLGAALLLAGGAASLLPYSHRYWLPLTTLVVLKPDFSTTFTRGVARVLGTLAGAGLATLVAALLRPGPVALAALVSVLAWAGYTVFRANYAALAVCITALVVFLVSFAGLPEITVVEDRTTATVLGGLLAMVVYAGWPTWEAARVPEQLAALVAAQGRYGDALLTAYVDPSRRDRQRLRDLRGAARLARSNAEASVDRMVVEPRRALHAMHTDVALGVLAAARRYALAVLALHAHVPQLAASAPPAETAELAAALTAALRRGSDLLVAALGEARPAATLPPLRDMQLALAAALATAVSASAHVIGGGAGAGASGTTMPSGVQDADPSLDAALLDVETDLMVDSVNSIADLLAHLEPAVPQRHWRLRGPGFPA